MKLRIASDVGGTFTDSIAYDSVSRRISVSKVPTTPLAREVGTVESLRRTLKELGAEGAAVDYVGHGMTTATNAVIQRSGAKTAFVTTRGLPRGARSSRSPPPTWWRPPPTCAPEASKRLL